MRKVTWLLVGLMCLALGLWAWVRQAAPAGAQRKAAPGATKKAGQQRPAQKAAAAAKQALSGVPLPELQPRKEDFPAVAADASGRLWAAWLYSDEGKDRLQVASLRAPSAGDLWERDQVWQVPVPTGAAIGEPALAAGRNGLWLAAALEVNRQWDIYVCPVTADGPGKLAAVTRDAAADARPALVASPEGRVWLAWESNAAGERGIYAASAGADGKFGRSERLSAPGSNAYNPNLAAVRGGVAVAYDSFRDSNSDIYLRVYDARGWQPERRLSVSPLLDRHPVLATDGTGLWVAWQAQAFSSALYRMGDINTQMVRVTRIDPSGLSAPLAMDDARFSQWISRPSIAFDPAGRLWLSARVSLSQHEGWETVYYCYSGGAWSERLPLARFQGRVRAVPMLFSAGRLAAAQQMDTLLGAVRSYPAKPWDSNIVFTGLELGKAPPATPLRVEPYREPPAGDFDLKAARFQRNEDGPRRAIDYQGQRLSLYWGDFHDHSNVSVCNRRGNPPPEDLYPNLRDIARLDFAGITDHGYDFDAYLWNWNGKNARINHDPGRFLGFQAQEWTSDQVPPEAPDGMKRYGHRNLFYADPFFGRWFNARNNWTPRQLWDALAGVDFITIPHQLADTGNCPTDWNYTDDALQPVAEIFQSRGSYEYLGAPRQPARAMTEKGHYIQDAWARGVVIGVVASPDHGGGAGKSAIYAERLDRGSVLDAVRARRTYGTTGARIFLDVRVNGRLMGEKLPAPSPGQPVEVAVRVIGAGSLEAVEVCRNNEFVYKREGKGPEAQFTFRDTAAPSGRLWYYVRVIQSDGQMAWSSPVWLGE